MAGGGWCRWGLVALRGGLACGVRVLGGVLVVWPLPSRLLLLLVAAAALALCWVGLWLVLLLLPPLPLC